MRLIGSGGAWTDSKMEHMCICVLRGRFTQCLPLGNSDAKLLVGCFFPLLTENKLGSCFKGALVDALMIVLPFPVC